MQELTIVIWPIYDIRCLKCRVDSLEQQNSVTIISPSYHQLAIVCKIKQEAQYSLLNHLMTTSKRNENNK